MSPLERLGLEVVAFNILGSRMESSILCALLECGGRIASWEHLGKARRWRMVDTEEATKNAIKVRISLLRSKMEDVGMGVGLIKTHEGQGYSLPEPGRSEVLARLVEEAA